MAAAAADYPENIESSFKDAERAGARAASET